MNPSRTDIPPKFKAYSTPPPTRGLGGTYLYVQCTKTFAMAKLYHFGEAVPQDFAQAAVLYEKAYNNGVVWAARGL